MTIHVRFTIFHFRSLSKQQFEWYRRFSVLLNFDNFFHCQCTKICKSLNFQVKKKMISHSYLTWQRSKGYHCELNIPLLKWKYCVLYLILFLLVKPLQSLNNIDQRKKPKFVPSLHHSFSLPYTLQNKETFSHRFRIFVDFKYLSILNLYPLYLWVPNSFHFHHVSNPNCSNVVFFNSDK